VTFMLRILFSGLMTFIPSQDGTEVTVLLLNVDHKHLSDNSVLDHHNPLLIARAGDCSGDCPKRDADVAAVVFPDKSPSVAADSIEEAVGGGGAWLLSGSDLSVKKTNSGDPNLPALVFRDDARGTANGQPLPIPTSSTEREDFSWVADLKQICPTDCTVNTDLLGENPPGIVVARLKLKTGKIFTYSVARIGTDVTPVHFKRLDGQGSVSSYSQAIATWVGADIEVSADSIDIVEEKFNGDPGRTMTLSPDESGKVEIAVLNLPPFVPPTVPFTGTPDVGKHFEAYYDIVETPPSDASRFVPYAGAASTVGSYPEVSWQEVHPTNELWSELLNKIRLNLGRTAYEQALCPPGKNPLP
jgi:hypothetical protein